jgi:hypothetical protein
VRTQTLRNIPTQPSDREGWATDIDAAFAAPQIETSVQHICAALAVAAQESSFNADPPCPASAGFARVEIGCCRAFRSKVRRSRAIARA